MKLRTILFTLCCMQISAVYGMVKTKRTQQARKVIHFDQSFRNFYITWGDDYIKNNEHSRAIDCFAFAARSSCSHTRAEAYLKLGSLYYFGGTGVTKNYETAIKYLEAAAFQKIDPTTDKPSNPKARAKAWLVIAQIYLNGDQHVAKNTEYGNALLEAAAKQTDDLKTQKEALAIIEENNLFATLNNTCAIL